MKLVARTLLSSAGLLVSSSLVFAAPAPVASTAAAPKEAIAAKSVCKSVEECRSIIKQAKADIEMIAKKQNLRIAISGAIFARDNSKPLLGEAYRDSSGLIWGSVVKVNGKTKEANPIEAAAVCKSLGARLPTFQELTRLSTELAGGSTHGTDKQWSPFLTDAKTQVLPEIADYTFWSSTMVGPVAGIPRAVEKYLYTFDGFQGSVNSEDPMRNRFQIRCVADTKK